MTSNVARKSKKKNTARPSLTKSLLPGVEHVHFSETIYALDGSKRVLTYSPPMREHHVCHVCALLTDTVKCYVCNTFICEGCTSWHFRNGRANRKDKPRIIDVYCSCNARIYNEYC